ncbi:MAG: arginine--tRNA ligase [Myxococcota bacterium]
MAHPVARLSELVSAAVVKSFGPEHANADPAVHRSSFADYQADVAMKLARSLKKPPIEVARSVAEALDVSELCEDVKVSPPGFVNFTLRREVLEAELAQLLRDARAGASKLGENETVVIDYPSPNAAKEMHVGHLRSSVIGDSLTRVFEFLGQRVVRQNHIGDWGTPFGMLIEHLIDLGSEEARSQLAVGELNAFYKAARAKFDADANFAERARLRVVALQAGEPETLGLWQNLIDASLSYFRQIYTKLGLTLKDEDVRGESFYNPFLAEVAGELEQLGVAQIDQGALCVFSPEFKGREGEPLPLIVRKQDGGFGYAATDLAAIRYRTRVLGATRILYVVGSPQQQHFAMVFSAARRAGYLAQHVRAEHVAFGSVLGSDRKLLRTRSGDSPRLLELLNEAVERIDALIREKNPELGDSERAEVAESVGVGALKYADLSSERIKDYIFDWNRMLAFEGNTGPYLHYAHARLCSILRKAVNEHGVELAAQLLRGDVPQNARVRIEDPRERALTLELLDFPSAVEAVASSLQPHRLCTYLYQLATTYTTFHENCPVLRADTPEQRDARLLLCAATRRVLALGLGLLGMGAPERM